MKPETKTAALRAAAENNLTAFRLIVKNGPRGRTLYSFVQFHESLEAARERSTKTLAESGLVLVSVEAVRA